MGRGAQRWSNGPWKRVRDTPSAFNNAPDELVSATNIYLQDTVNGSGAFARWGYDASNGGTAFANGAQCVITHLDASGTRYNFVIAGGKMYRSSFNNAFGAWVDVTPTVTSPISPTAKIYALSSNGFLVINDEDNIPWIASTLSASAVTKTNIDIDGLGGVWQAVGQPVEYAGSVIFALRSVGGVACPTDITWSAPGAPAVGYQQNPYDFRWTLLAANSDPINALWATNLSLYYFRDYSIGALTGTPATAGSTSGSDFRNASTQDAISALVGCNTAKTIHQFGNNIFFSDVKGRPWMMALGGFPTPIWKQMQSVIDEQGSVDSDQSGQPEKTKLFALGAIFPTLNLYLCGNWTHYATFPNYTFPTSLSVFDATTGAYEGQWQLGNGLPIAATGTLVLNTTNGTSQAPMNAIVGGSSTSLPNLESYMWVAGENSIWADASQGSFAGGAVKPGVTTPRFGFDANKVQTTDTATVITGNASQIQLTVTTPQDMAVVSPTPPSSSTDGTFRATAGVQVMGRGITAKVEQLNAQSSQWSVQQIVVQGTECLAGPDDV